MNFKKNYNNCGLHHLAILNFLARAYFSVSLLLKVLLLSVDARLTEALLLCSRKVIAPKWPICIYNIKVPTGFYISLYNSDIQLMIHSYSNTVNKITRTVRH